MFASVPIGAAVKKISLEKADEGLVFDYNDCSLVCDLWYCGASD